MLTPFSFTPQSCLLRQGDTITIREAQVEDAKALNQLIRTYLQDSDYIPLEVEEFTKTEEETKQWITSLQQASNSLLLVVEHNGQFIGNIDVTGNSRKALQHTAILGMGILKSWRGCGLGTLLVQHVIDWAKSANCLEILWLQVYAENKAAVALYHKHGFEIMGRMPEFIKVGAYYYTNQIMQRQVK